jgi:fructokinase
MTTYLWGTQLSWPIMRIGIDLGGTKIELIALDDGGAERLRHRQPTPHNDYRAMLEAVGLMVRQTEQELETTCSVGIGTPGAISPASGLLRNSNSVCLNGRPFKQDIEALLGREIRMANDANCFALSEALDGAGAGTKVVFGVIIGTGCGAGVVVDGKVLTGPNAIAGEWGHNALPWPQPKELPGPPCYCGKHGCIETWVSGPGMSRDHRLSGGKSLNADEIVACALGGDALCQATLDRYEARLARGLAQVINILDPDVIVLGGGLSNIGRLYEDIPRLWQAYLFSEVANNRLLPPKHGDSSGVRGAAWLW